MGCFGFKQSQIMKIYILIADIETNDRTDIEGMENQVFESPEHALQHTNEGDVINNKCMPLTDFLDFVNNEEFYEGGSWITSVLIGEI